MQFSPSMIVTTRTECKCYSKGMVDVETSCMKVIVVHRMSTQSAKWVKSSCMGKFASIPACRPSQLSGPSPGYTGLKLPACPHTSIMHPCPMPNAPKSASVNNQKQHMPKLIGPSSDVAMRPDRQPRGRTSLCRACLDCPHQQGAVRLHRKQRREEFSSAPPGYQKELITR